MKANSDAREAKDDYDLSAAIKVGRSAKAQIEGYTLPAEVVCRVMESGMSLGNPVAVRNQWRRRKTLKIISYVFLQRFVRSSAVRVLEEREVIQSGSKNEGATWAWARCSSRSRQLRKGARIAAGGPAFVAAKRW